MPRTQATDGLIVGFINLVFGVFMLVWAICTVISWLKNPERRKVVFGTIAIIYLTIKALNWLAQ